MSLSNFLNTADFYTYAGISSSEVNSSYVTYIITKMNALINKELSNVFCFTPDFTSNITRNNSDKVAIIGNWQRAGVMDLITITAGGTGYTSTPTVTITGDGSGATAEATVESEVVTAITITNQGKGYTTAPTITITGGDGSGATATSTISTLVIEVGYEDDPTDLTTLTEGDDYRVLYFDDDLPNQIYPIVGVKLRTTSLVGNKFIKVTGTYGYSASVPDEVMLEMDMYNIVKKAILSAENDTETGGKGKVSSTKIDKVSINFSNTEGSSDYNMSVEQAMYQAKELIDVTLDNYTFDSGLLPIIVG